MILAVLLMAGSWLGQVDPQRIAQICGQDEPDTVCAYLLELTGNDLLARVGGALLVPLVKIAVIVVVAFLVGRAIRRLIRRFVRTMQDQGVQRLSAMRQRGPFGDQAAAAIDTERATMRTETIGGVLRSVATFTVWTLATLMVLGTVGINLGPLIAGAGIAGIALGFGAQNLVKDFLSGIFMIVEDQYGLGDVIDVGEATGKVEAISLRITRLRDVEGTVWHVPNGEIRRVGNKSQQWARTLLDVGVAYGTDLEHASAVMTRVADELWKDPEWSDKILEEPELWGVENFGANEIVMRLVVKVRPLQQWPVNRELRRRLKEAFDAEGIEIPFPQRTLWLRQDEDAAAPLTPAKHKSNGRDTAGD